MPLKSIPDESLQLQKSLEDSKSLPKQPCLSNLHHMLMEIQEQVSVLW